ncbi:glycosyltransferase family 58 protein [Crucibulum laeve]|uniref:Dol-P-Man:Man(5)GlcNAc(2)-PP-Dol alpha-1,3-mannosyltransferase n=1 Tax=Crucibulum laeve TaxID=68775 RepID=A0A5C3MEF2_9AGAR|nr:glycosyltransferase family 58 protein [Crucibulum laeve]
MSSTTSPIRYLVRGVRLLLTDSRYFWPLATLVIIGDAFLTELIIKFIPYTEIDWETYMVQTDVYLKGQNDYSLITGPTGPLVYPAGHLRIHQFLYAITDAGKNIRLAQHVYAGLYLGTLILSCNIYRRASNIPNWVLLLLPLSKRLHSIFVLRLFNDCWAVFALQAAVLAYQNGFDDTGTMLFSAALSIKMSILLYLPGILLILFKRRGMLATLLQLVTIGTLQILFAVPFLKQEPWSYLRSAFDLGRVFLYKWTVNWRFVDEQTFLSPQFALTLLVGHVSALVAFGLFKWCKPDGSAWVVLKRGLNRPAYPAGLSIISPDYVATVLFTSNLIGILFARSLHYQFYSWYAQQTPFLAWRTRYPVPFKLALILAIEYAWNVFPSTTFSSSVLVGANALLLAGVWLGHPSGIPLSKDSSTTRSVQ